MHVLTVTFSHGAILVYYINGIIRAGPARPGGSLTPGREERPRSLSPSCMFYLLLLLLLHNTTTLRGALAASIPACALDLTVYYKLFQSYAKRRSFSALLYKRLLRAHGPLRSRLRGHGADVHT